MTLLKKIKLTAKSRATIKVGAVVEIPINNFIKVDKNEVGHFYLRKKYAKLGLIQSVHTPFNDWSGTPLIVVQNNHVSDIEIMKDEEVGEIWIFGEA